MAGFVETVMRAVNVGGGASLNEADKFLEGLNPAAAEAARAAASGIARAVKSDIVVAEGSAKKMAALDNSFKEAPATPAEVRPADAKGIQF